MGPHGTIASSAAPSPLPLPPAAPAPPPPPSLPLPSSPQGLWNEVSYSPDWAVQLRAALDDAGYANTRIVASDTGGWEPVAGDMAANATLADAIDVIGAHYPGSAPTNETAAWARAHGKSVWASEMWNLGVSDDYPGGMAMASDLSRFARYGLSASIAWCLVYSWWPSLNYGWYSNTTNGGRGHALTTAAEPWSGHWEVSPPLAVMAHWTQVAKPGWRYLSTAGTGVGTLPGGGSYATLVDADALAAGRVDASVVVETTSATAPQSASFTLVAPPGVPLPAALHVWRTVEGALFQQQPDVPVDASGTFTLQLLPDAVYSVTTTTGQGWVTPSQPVPPTAPFPFPYAEDFEGYAQGAYARYWSDMVRGGPRGGGVGWG